MPFELNQALLKIKRNMRPPWTEMQHGREPSVPFGYEDDDSLSKAPTRQQSEQPEDLPPVIPNKGMPTIPEEEHEETSSSKQKTKKEGKYIWLHRRRKQTSEQTETHSVKRKKARSLSPPGRISASNYAAVEVGGAFGLIDDGAQGSAQLLVAHAPRDPTRLLALRQGDSIQALSTLHSGGFAMLRVLFITRSQYFQPGRKVTSISLGVPKNEWDMLQVRRQKFVRTL